jgi:hypothetical protein
LLSTVLPLEDSSIKNAPRHAEVVLLVVLPISGRLELVRRRAEPAVMLILVFECMVEISQKGPSSAPSDTGVGCVDSSPPRFLLICCCEPNFFSEFLLSRMVDTTVADSDSGKNTRHVCC